LEGRAGPVPASIEELAGTTEPGAAGARKYLPNLEGRAGPVLASNGSGSLPTGPVAAFCGLGQPRSFWRTLESLNVKVAFRWAFGDHHAYRPSELKRLAAQASAAGARVLVTTEKDMMNLPSGAKALLQPLELFWLEIGVEIDDEERLLRRIV
jgi:tetraacyldisaccharide 4'-kinase